MRISRPRIRDRYWVLVVKEASTNAVKALGWRNRTGALRSLAVPILILIVLRFVVPGKSEH